MTTNRELIEHLQKFPLDAPVIIDMFSESYDMDLDRIELDDAYHYYNGKWMHWTAKWWPKNRPLPDELVTVVHFPGN